MRLTDPVADMLTRVRNALQARHQKVDIPASRLKVEIARILKEEGYVSNFKATEEEGHKVIRIYLKYGAHNEAAISKAGSRVAPRLPRVCAAQRDSPGARRHGDQHPDHAARSDDGTPGAQGRRGRRVVVRDLVEKQLSAISRQPSARAAVVKKLRAES
jgi:ribosomal protein S8